MLIFSFPGNLLVLTPIFSDQFQNLESGSGDCSLEGWSETNNSKTIDRDFSALGEFTVTSIPSVGFLIHEAARVLSPFISTIQARQLPSAL